MSIRKELASRWKPEYAKLGVVAPLQAHMNGVLDVRDRLEAKRAELQGNRELSDVGRAKAMRVAADAEAKHVAKASRALRLARGKTEQQRAALTPTVSNKGDVAAATLRGEIRTALRGMDRSKIAAIAGDPNTDTIVLEALFEAPGWLIGVDTTTRQQLLDIVLDRHAGPALALLNEQSEALAVAGAAVQAASDTLAQAAALGNAPDAFGKYLTLVAPPTEQEIADEQSVYRKDAVVIDALSLPAAQRSSLIDQLLAANTAEFKAA